MAQQAEAVGPIHPARGTGPTSVRRRRILYNATTLALLALAGLVVADVFGPVLGVDSATESSPVQQEGGVLTVTYPEVTRPALASPFSVEITRPDGFDQPIEIAVSRPWIEVWDENGFYPTPSSETGDELWVVWEFDPPDGDTFRFFYDARLEPAMQHSVRGAVELRDGSEVLAAVTFVTEVRP